MKTKDMTYAALFAGVIAVSAFISIPTPLVPFTLQPFAITLTALVLDRKQAMLAIGLYVVCGLLGLPIFSGGSGGFQTLIKPTFGFILGFIPMTFMISSLKNYRFLGMRLASMFAGLVVLYGVAMPYLYFNLHLIQGITIQVGKMLTLYCLVYLPSDMISSLVASFISDRLIRQRKNDFY